MLASCLHIIASLKKYFLTSMKCRVFNKVYCPLADIDLMSSAYISAGLSWAWHLVQMKSGFNLNLSVGKGVTNMASGRLKVSLFLADKPASKS